MKKTTLVEIFTHPEKTRARKWDGNFMEPFISFPLRNPIVTEKYPFSFIFQRKMQSRVGCVREKNKWLSQSRLRSWMLVRDRERADKVAK